MGLPLLIGEELLVDLLLRRALRLLLGHHVEKSTIQEIA
jgi:hypothetical protein